MATLKYRDTNGNFIRIPSIQGPPGPKGDKGDKGATGPAGGILEVAASSTKGYITVTKADNTTKQVAVGVTGDFLPLTGGTVTGATQICNIGFFNDTVTSGTNAASRSVLAICGNTYGNPAEDIKTAGKLSFGDPGPQIIFGVGSVHSG